MANPKVNSKPKNCPHCGAELTDIGDKILVCDDCGYEYHG